MDDTTSDRLSTFAFFSYLKTSEPVRLGSFTFRSTTDRSDGQGD